MQEVTISCLYGKHGIEIGIWFLSKDNSQSWVSISHGSNKFVIYSNYNNTVVLADLPEERASRTSVKVFAARSKAKSKPQKREIVELPSTIPMNERKWIDIEPSEPSLSAYEVSKKVINLLRLNQTVQREDDGGVQFWRIKIFFKLDFHKQIIGRMIVGNLVWQQEEEQKGVFSIALIFQEQFFISVLFKDIQDVITWIFHYKTI